MTYFDTLIPEFIFITLLALHDKHHGRLVMSGLLLVKILLILTGCDKVVCFSCDRILVPWESASGKLHPLVVALEEDAGLCSVTKPTVTSNFAAVAASGSAENITW